MEFFEEGTRNRKSAKILFQLMIRLLTVNGGGGGGGGGGSIKGTVVSEAGRLRSCIIIVKTPSGRVRVEELTTLR